MKRHPAKHARAVMDSVHELGQVLPHVLLLTCGAGLMRFELTGKGMKCRISSVVQQNVAKNPMISEDARVSCSDLIKPNGFTIFSMEQHRCMVCKEAYHGRVNPFFGVYAHDGCISPLLTAQDRFNFPVPLARIIKEVPFEMRRKRCWFLTTKVPGFPSVTVDDWIEAQTKGPSTLQEDDQLHHRQYLFSNLRSQKQVQKEERAVQKALNKQWHQAINTELKKQGCKKTYRGIRRSIFLPCIDFYGPVLKSSIKTVVEQHLSVVELLDMYSPLFVQKMVFSPVSLEEWNKLVYIRPFDAELRDYDRMSVFEVAEFIDDMYCEKEFDDISMPTVRLMLRRHCDLTQLKEFFKIYLE